MRSVRLNETFASTGCQLLGEERSPFSHMKWRVDERSTVNGGRVPFVGEEGQY